MTALQHLFDHNRAWAAQVEHQQLGSESHCFEFFGSVQANHPRGFLAHCLTACKTSVNSVGQMGLLAPSSARRGGRGRGE